MGGDRLPAEPTPATGCEPVTVEVTGPDMWDAGTRGPTGPARPPAAVGLTPNWWSAWPCPSPPSVLTATRCRGARPPHLWRRGGRQSHLASRFAMPVTSLRSVRQGARVGEPVEVPTPDGVAPP